METVVNNYQQFLSAEGAQVSHCYYQSDSLLPSEYDILIILVADLASNSNAVQKLACQLTDTSKVCLSVQEQDIDQTRQYFPLARIINAHPMTRFNLIETVKKLWQNSFELELEEFDLSELSLELENSEQQTELKNGVLVVEDNPLNQKLIKKQLNNLGYQCDIAIIIIDVFKVIDIKIDHT